MGTSNLSSRCPTGIDAIIRTGKAAMKNVIAIAAGLSLAATAAFAQPATSGRAEILSSVPSRSVTVTDWYKQSVYDPSDSKIGDVQDVLVSPDGRATTLIVAVGGFLGVGE